MKKLLMFLGLIGFIFFAGCEEIVEEKRDCEVNSYGSVIVKNKTGYAIYVDVTEGSSEYNDERRLSNGGSTTYRKIRAGRIKVWASFSGDVNDWSYRNNTMSSCSEITESWRSSGAANMSSIVIFDNSYQKIKN